MCEDCRLGQNICRFLRLGRIPYYGIRKGVYSVRRDFQKNVYSYGLVRRAYAYRPTEGQPLRQVRS
jgi:hypothetical protein